jgi:hypothetical protein
VDGDLQGGGGRLREGLRGRSPGWSRACEGGAAHVCEPSCERVDAVRCLFEGVPLVEQPHHLVRRRQVVQGLEGLVHRVAAPALADPREDALVAAAVDGAVLSRVGRHRHLPRLDAGEVLLEGEEDGRVRVLVEDVARRRVELPQHSEHASALGDAAAEEAAPPLEQRLPDDVQRVDVGDLRRVVAASLTAGAVAAARAEGVAEEEDEESEEGPREAEEQVEVPQDLPPDRVVLAPVAGALAAGGSADAARAERVPERRDEGARPEQHARVLLDLVAGVRAEPLAPRLGGRFSRRARCWRRRWSRMRCAAAIEVALRWRLDGRPRDDAWWRSRRYRRRRRRRRRRGAHQR